MPLTVFQKAIASILAVNRTPGSHLVGGAAINRADASPRYSNDLDLFHDDADLVAGRAAADAEVLRTHGISVTWLIRQHGFCRAQVARGADALKLDWCSDSIFRFFPVQPDDIFGYCLHPADLATNKALALAGRVAIRDL